MQVCVCVCVCVLVCVCVCVPTRAQQHQQQHAAHHVTCDQVALCGWLVFWAARIQLQSMKDSGSSKLCVLPPLPHFKR